MARHDRLKASDVFRHSEFLLGKTCSFGRAFPEIEDLTVVVQEEGDGVAERNRQCRYTKKNAAEFVNCSNPQCYNGGFSLGGILRYMVATKKTHLSTQERCQGYEGSPKGRKKYRECLNHFSVSVNIKFRGPITRGDQ